jgi:hypothetical protein
LELILCYQLVVRVDPDQNQVAGCIGAAIVKRQLVVQFAVRGQFFSSEGRGRREGEQLVARLSPRKARTKVRQSRRGPFPSETDVVDLAALWGIDPSRLEDQDHPTTFETGRPLAEESVSVHLKNRVLPSIKNRILRRRDEAPP